jgi:hypothetical protein
MLPVLRRKVVDGLLVAADVAGLLACGAGASVVLLLGKLMLAAVLAALALGFFLRLAGRRRPPPLAPARPPAWYYGASALLAAVEVALLVEATKLPVRFDQPGFERWHWGLVLAALAVAYLVQLQIFRALGSRRRGAAQP